MKAYALLIVLFLLFPYTTPSINAILTASSDNVYVGDSITLTLNVTNTMDEDVYNVTVYRQIPSGFSLVKNESRIPFKERLKPNESVTFTVEIRAERAGEFYIEPAIVKFVYKNEEYVAYSNRVKITVLDQTQKAIEESTSTAVKYAAILGGLSGLGLLIALIVRRPKKPRSI